MSLPENHTSSRTNSLTFPITWLPWKQPLLQLWPSLRDDRHQDPCLLPVRTLLSLVDGSVICMVVGVTWVKPLPPFGVSSSLSFPNLNPPTLWSLPSSEIPPGIPPKPLWSFLFSPQIFTLYQHFRLSFLEEEPETRLRVYVTY